MVSCGAPLPSLRYMYMKLTYANTDFEVNAGSAFVPTDTSRLLIECALKEIAEGDRVLDLGCGSGVVGLVIAQLKNLPLVWLSDVHEESRASVELNFRSVGQGCEFRAGDLFEPWNGERFDVIVDDVSGVSEPLANHSRWFQGVPCASGIDGADLVTRVIENAPRFLNPDGRLIFPTISLSNVSRIVETARTHFGCVTNLGSIQWPLPQELLIQRELLESLESKGAITLIRKFGMLLGRTEILLAR